MNPRQRARQQRMNRERSELAAALRDPVTAAAEGHHRDCCRVTRGVADNCWPVFADEAPCPLSAADLAACRDIVKRLMAPSQKPSFPRPTFDETPRWLQRMPLGRPRGRRVSALGVGKRSAGCWRFSRKRGALVRAWLEGHRQSTEAAK